MSQECATRIGAVVLAYGDEPLLSDCLAALLASDVARVVVVDNGPHRHEVTQDARLTRLGPGRNTGFAGGCNLAAERLVADCDVLMFVNSDLIVNPHAPRLLADALDVPSVGLVMGLVVEADRPEVINSAGNPIHYSLLSWAGGWGLPAAGLTGTWPVPSASGALMAMRAATWQQMDGLCEPHFAYGEDVELSVRVWQAGLSVVCVADAVGRHAYAFDGGELKMYLLERNRLANLVTLLEADTLTVLLPGLAVVEAGILAASLRGGWLGAKVSGYRWLWAHRTEVMARRRWVQSQRLLSDREVGWIFSDAITPGAGTGVAVPTVMNTLLTRWRRLAWPARSGSGRVVGVGPVPAAGPAVTGDAPAECAEVAPDTRGGDYTERLVTLEGARWKRILDVQRPYRRRLQRMTLGRTLDIGCGIGRNLSVSPGMVGVDHNAASVAVARARGFRAWTTDEWPDCPDALPESFDSVLIAHVLEHVDAADGEALLRDYLQYLRAGGRVVMICPQESGYASDATHVRYLDADALSDLARGVGLKVVEVSSFPFPRWMGRAFRHNEHVVVARKPQAGDGLKLR